MEDSYERDSGLRLGSSEITRPTLSQNLKLLLWNHPAH